jgi:hypothetical protein
LVTVTIGGNDLGYMTAIGKFQCPNLTDEERNRYFGGTCTPFTPLTIEAKQKLAADMDRMIATIHQRRQGARSAGAIFHAVSHLRQLRRHGPYR